MKIWKYLLLFLTVLAGLCSSCSNSQPQSITPTAKVFPATSTPTNTPNTPITREDFSCWPVKPLLEGNDIKGSLVYANYADHTIETDHIFAWDVSSFHSKPMKITSKLLNEFGGAFISPDGNHIAVLSGEKLILLSSEGEQSFSLPSVSVAIKNYLSDGRILLTDLENFRNGYQKGKEFTDIYYILDPQTSAITKHSALLPNVGPNSQGVLIIEYSPDLKYVLYRSLSEETDIKFTLFDLEKSEEVWVGPLRDTNLKNDSYTIPVWKSDSTSLTSMYYSGNGKNYYAISLDGNISPITNLEDMWLEPTFSPNSWWSYNAAFPNWSPNGRYLVSSGSQGYNRSSLYIWDDKEKIEYKPCLPDEEYKITTSIFTNWSFANGAYFMVSLGFTPTAPPMPGAPQPWKVFKSYILDLDNKVIYELPDEFNNGEFNSPYKGGDNIFLGWVNWEIP